MMILTSCVVPVAVFLALILLFKGLFGSFLTPEITMRERPAE